MFGHSNFVVGDIRDLEDCQQIFSYLHLLYDFCGCIVIKH